MTAPVGTRPSRNRTAPCDPERTARRLLGSAARSSYDPEVDVDWDAPLLEGRPFIPFRRCSLYGTALWERMSERQRIELSRHEAASLASAGVWFELILMQFLLRNAYDEDPTRAHLHWGLTEIADECRHSVMFGKMVHRLGVPAYGPARHTRELGRVLKTAGWGPSVYAATLIAEELLDRMQRDFMDDEEVQPLIRMINRIHVMEEARHISYAREEVLRGMRGLRGPALATQQLVTGLAAQQIAGAMYSPDCYPAVGLDRRRARREARANPRHRETMRWAGEKVVDFLGEAGLIGGPGLLPWRRSLLLERPLR